ncbi:MAG: T9SS type A sorting domain-containing protein [Ignavibacterium sp.]|nr:MAG: T9SS type A sorting domain-containing protein [Ignavibacterium sp.]
MKKLLTVITFFFLSISVFCQVEDTTYLPLIIGNEWQYYNGYKYFFSSIEKDSIFSNGQRYFNVPSFPIYGYLRVDSLGNIWSIGDYGRDEEFIAVKIDAQLEESWIIHAADQDTVFAQYLMNDEWTVFGEVRNVKEYKLYDDTGYLLVGFVLAKGLGLVMEYYDDGTTVWLNYAKINGQIYGDLVGIEKEKELPQEFIVSQNYPNPFNGITNIRVELPFYNPSQDIELSVYDILGREILKKTSFINKSKVIQLNTDDYNLSSGTYFYQARTKTNYTTKKLAYLK